MAGRGSNEAPAMAAEVFSHSRRSCRRSIGLLLDMLHLQVPFAKFVREVVAGAPAQGHNGPRRILATGTEGCAETVHVGPVWKHAAAAAAFKPVAADEFRVLL